MNRVANALVEIMETGTYNKKAFILPDLVTIKEPETIRGNYRSDNGNKIEISGDKALLHIQLNEELKYNLYIVDSVTGYAPGIDAWIKFTKEQDHTVLIWKSVFFQEHAIKLN